MPSATAGHGLVTFDTGTSRRVLDAIGNTPLVELRRVVPAGSARIIAKLESANPTGSMKDRVARAMVERAAADGRLPPGGTVVEYTAGTTGISLALMCAARGYKAHFVFSDAFSDEKRRTMRAYGAQLTDVVSDKKRITEQLIKAMIAMATEISRRPAPSQCVGTAHSIHGAAHALRRHNPRLHVAGVEPAESAVLSGKPSGSHQIEGIGIGFIPPLWRREEVNEIFMVASDEAKAMARRLAREEAIFAGTSSGANIVAALQVAKQLGAGATVGTIIIDSGLRYVSTDVFRT